MQTEQVHTLILGAGPSGLAAGYTLARAGLRPVILEKDKVPGGLMRSIQRGEFIMDIGRKELYNRIAKVDAFWHEILGSDYRLYAHRGGILYHGHIIERSASYRGFRRGMPWHMLLGCGVDFLRCRAQLVMSKPHTLEEYWYRTRGRRLTQIVSQGFQEKLTGRKWADIPLPPEQADGHGTSFLRTVKAGLQRALSRQEANTYQGIWRHPARGTGQICESLARAIVQAGGHMQYEACVVDMVASPRQVNAVTVEIGAERVTYRPLHVVSSIPIEFLARFLLPQRSESGGDSSRAADPLHKTVVLVYLFCDEPPRFPHAWLEVTCPQTRLGRITNYAAFNGDMVPEGKTCLCCEFYCFGADPLLELKTEEIAKLALAECAKYQLVDHTKCFDHLVLKFPGADASQNRDNWMSKPRLRLMAALKQFENVYYVNRTDLDIATLAGIEAAEAILSGDRTQFDWRIDPAQLQIRSASKAFEFSPPAGVEV